MPSATPSERPPVVGARPLFAGAAMRDADGRAERECGVPSFALMERAGLEAARIVAGRFPERRAALVLVGSGNNGGDGYVLARHLAEAGWDVVLRHPRGARVPEGDAAIAARIAASIGLRATELAGATDPRALVVDALLGTGASGPPRPELAAAIAAATGGGGPVVSLDVPTGVDADTGTVAGVAVRADLTITFHGDKVGLRVDPGRTHAGEVVVVDIGIPSTIASAPSGWLIGPETLAGAPRRPASGDKYRAGSVGIVAGSPGMTGAAWLAARGAQRAGAGIVIAGLPAAALAEPGALPVEAVGLPLPAEGDGHLGASALDPVLDQIGRLGAVVIGPGLGRAAATGELVRRAITEISLPLVVDADALWHLDPAALAVRSAPTVLTPHAGEAARLLGTRRKDVDAGRAAAAVALADATGQTVLLKGPGTLVVAPGRPLAVVREGGPELATAGSGDVLAGVVAAFLAAGLDPVVAAAVAAAAHARAGVLAGRGSGTTAGDLAEALPEALAAT